MEYLSHEKPIEEYTQTIERLKQQNQAGLFDQEIAKLEKKRVKLKEKIYGSLTPWERVQICRHPNRPHTLDYIHHLCSDFEELSGDRMFGEDASIVGGLAQVGPMKCVLIGQEKGNDTESRLHHNFGMVSPEGFRKSLRLMQMAEKFHLPVLTFVDTSGANPCLEAEERGQGLAIANNLQKMVRLKVPIIVLIIGEGCSGGALGIAVGDVIGMLEHAYYSVISPEGCASILWKDPEKREEAAATLKLNAEHLLEQGIVDEVIGEPLGGAHYDPEEMFLKVKTFILDQWKVLQNYPEEVLLEQRYHKFRKMGKFLQT